MTPRLIATLIAASTCFTAYAHTQGKSATTTSTAEQEILELNRAWADAVTKGDASALDRLFADDLIVTSGSGVIRNKTAEIKDATAGSDPDVLSEGPFTTEDVRVKVYEGAAIVAGLVKWSFKYKGVQNIQERRYMHTYIRQNGRWRIASQQVSQNLYRPPKVTP